MSQQSLALAMATSLSVDLFKALYGSIFELELSKNGEFCFFRDPENVDARGETNSLFLVRLLIKCFTTHFKANIEKKNCQKII